MRRVDGVAVIHPAAVPQLPVTVLHPLFRYPFRGDAVAVQITLIELSVAQELRQQTVINRVVLVLDELPEKIARHRTGDLAYIHFDGACQCRALCGAVRLGSQHRKIHNGQ
ncbi:MAG: hypothetical protein ABSA59_00890 [Terriglobia bacterium]